MVRYNHEREKGEHEVTSIPSGEFGDSWNYSVTVTLDGNTVSSTRFFRHDNAMRMYRAKLCEYSGTGAKVMVESRWSGFKEGEVA